MKLKLSNVTDVTMNYCDFVVYMKRKTPKAVEVLLYSSPAGTLQEPIAVAFTEQESREIHMSFCLNATTGSPGRMKISEKEATALGKRLAIILFPPPVFKLFSESLALMVRKPHRGLRIRLALDQELMNLPWEYVYRVDRINDKGVSGFLLLDPTISIIREVPNPRISLKPISGRQHLTFVGTLWEGNIDRWEVKKEFQLLKKGLKPVSQYIAENYFQAIDWGDKNKISGNTAIFHYSGHCDIDNNGKGYLLLEAPDAGKVEEDKKMYLDDVAVLLRNTETRLVVLSACNSGFSAIVTPLIKELIPAILGINGLVANESAIEFCSKLYESLAVGLSLDEAVSRARMHLLKWGPEHNLFDWGLYMVYMPSAESVIFPRKVSAATSIKQRRVRKEHGFQINSTLQHVQEMDGLNFGEIMSELSKRRVLILGRFSKRRREILEAIKERLSEHPNGYIPELFTFDKPENRDLTESIIGFAALSRFIIADLSEPKSVQAELQAIVPNFLSVPVITIINKTGKPYSTFSSIERRENVVKPSIRYENLPDLLKKVDKYIIPNAEKKLIEVH